jgi:hypothetical protein
MPRPKVAMRRIKEVLRLKEGLGLSDTAVSRSARIARGTFYSGQEKRDRCNVWEAGSQRGRKSFVATPEQRNNVK